MKTNNKLIKKKSSFSLFNIEVNIVQQQSIEFTSKNFNHYYIPHTSFEKEEQAEDVLKATKEFILNLYTILVSRRCMFSEDDTCISSTKTK